MNETTPIDTAFLADLRHRGFAICVFTPEELRGVKPKYVEDGMCEHGFQVIETLTDEGDES